MRASVVTTLDCPPKFLVLVGLNQHCIGSYPTLEKAELEAAEMNLAFYREDAK